MSTVLETFKKDGFVIVPNVLSAKEIQYFRRVSEKYFNTQPSLLYDDGKCLPGFADVTNELQDLNHFHKDERILNVVQLLLGEKYIFAEHSDLHQNKLTGWHRDVLQGDYAKYQTLSVWGDKYQIVKVCFLLQDHVDNKFGLWFKRCSNKLNVNETNEIHAATMAGDMVVFDQRILHRGQSSHYKNTYNEDRYLITFGYGLDNEFTREHMSGTVARQTRQRQLLK